MKKTLRLSTGGGGGGKELDTIEDFLTRDFFTRGRLQTENILVRRSSDNN